MPQQRLFVGDSLAVLQDAFITAVQALKTADPLAPVTVLVPNALLASYLRGVVAKAGQGHLGLSFLTLRDFAHGLAENTLSQEGKRPLPPLAAPPIVRKLLGEAAPHNYFAPLAVQPGFPRSFLATITDLRQAGVQPQDLRAFIEQAHLTGTYRHKIDSLLALYDSYVRFLATHGFYDDTELLERAATLLADPSIWRVHQDLEPRSWVPSPCQGEGQEGGSDASRQWLRSAFDPHPCLPPTRGKGKHVTTQILVCSAYSTAPLLLYGFSDFTPVQRRLIEAAVRERDTLVFFLWRTGLAYEYATPMLGWFTSLGFRQTPLSSTETRESNLVRLQTQLFESTPLRPAATLQPDGSVTLLSAPGESREAREVGRIILKLVRDHHLRFDDIGVLLPDSTMYGPLLLETLSSLDIPCVFSSGLPLLQTQAGQSLLLLCQEESLAASEKVPRANSRQGWAEQIAALFRSSVSPTPHTTQVNEVLTRLGQLDFLAEQISLDEWRKEVTAALAATPLETGRGDVARVFIGDFFTARSLRFRAVIIPSLTEGRFPQTVRQDPLLLDAERQHMGEVLLRDLSQRNRLNEAQRLWFTVAAQSAAEYLVLTYPYLDQASGRTQVPSSYLFEAVEALTGRPASFADLEAFNVRVQLTPFSSGQPATAIDALEFHLASVELALARGDPTGLGYLPTTAPFFSRALYAVHQRWDVPQLTAFDGMIENESTKMLLHQHQFPSGTVLSASALETYARCPFRYFLNVVLGLISQEAPEDMLVLHPRDRGSLLHDILYDFFLRLRTAGRFPLAGQDQQELSHLLMQVAQEHFQEFARTRATGFPLLWTLEQERLHEQLILLLTRESEAGGEFLPTAFEAPFGEDVTDTQEQFFPSLPVRFALPDGEELRLHGRIDRIDMSADQQRARVIDYKSGKPVRGRFAGGTALQLPLYLFAARTLRPDLDWVSAEYVYVDHLGGARAPEFTADTWQETLPTLQEIVTTLVHGIRSGCFFPTPETCRPCAFPTICGTQIAARITRKQPDPRLQLLRQVRTIA
jgi:ATP-dependent helicase/DNAse subunit B